VFTASGKAAYAALYAVIVFLSPSYNRILNRALGTHNHKSLPRLIAEAGVPGRRRFESDAVASVRSANAPGARDWRPEGRPKTLAGCVARP
jgi:hypothetical protein